MAPVNAFKWAQVACDMLLFCSMAAHLWACPFTKVEESFNMQVPHAQWNLAPPPTPLHRASNLLELRRRGKGSHMVHLTSVGVASFPPLCPPLFFSLATTPCTRKAVHDLLEVGPSRIGDFDHLEFPGVVPRTFLGAGIVAAMAWPAHRFGAALPVAAGSFAGRFAGQLLARAALGWLTWRCFVSFRAGVAARLGSLTGCCLSLLTACQFHLPFYMTRPLPNTMALAPVLLAHGCWFRAAAAAEAAWASSISGSGGGTAQHHGGYAFIALVVAAAVLFRCDVLVLAAPSGLSLLTFPAHGAGRGLVTFWRGVAVGAAAGAAALAATVAVDSVLWRRWLWPEVARVPVTVPAHSSIFGGGGVCV